MSALAEAHDVRGNRLRIGREIARGGEGTIHDVPGRADLVAKLYHKPPDAERQGKLQTMARLGTERLRKPCAWPVEVLVERPGGPVRGFLMPRIEARQELHVLYGPHSRMQTFPKADYGFLVRAATNLARAFELVHEHGAVVGDVNDKIAMVGQDATIKLIDCDSFQITDAGRIFCCNVGVATHQPPEMQGVAFRGRIRSVNHDNFGLAVLIFQLLMLGRHPFSGRPLDNAEMLIEKAIRESRFVYGHNAAAMRMAPPPHAMSLFSLPQEVRIKFEEAFAEGGTRGGRPTAGDWVRALENFEKALKRCSRNPLHAYASSLAHCPICTIEVGAGVSLFLSTVVRVSPGTRVDLDPVMRQILGITGPAKEPDDALPRIDALTGERSDSMRKTIAVFIAAVAVLASGATQGVSLALLLVAALVWPWRNSVALAERQSALRQARAAYDALRAMYERDASQDRFEKAKAALVEAKARYDGLEAERRKRLGELERDKRRLQLDVHLDRHFIRKVKISGVGRTKKAALLSHNIETAKDVVEHKVRAVPGFGKVLTETMIKWRRSVEATFVFDASKGVDPQAIARVEQDILLRRTGLAQKIMEGPAHLNALAEAIEAARRRLKPELEQAARAVRDAHLAVTKL